MTAEIADLCISSNFYNNRLAQWEPIMMNWQLLLSVISFPFKSPTNRSFLQTTAQTYNQSSSNQNYN